ncbi:MAG: hypothetical protein RLY93_09225 [Sumerlaeia bacterium]
MNTETASHAELVQWVHYLPILTTLFSIFFFIVLARRYSEKGGGLHLLWWCAGVAAYGIGTAVESTVTVFSNTPLLTKAWYAFGAYLGGYPLAQGSVYLLFRRRTAHILTAISLPFVIVGVIGSFLSPVDLSMMEPHRPTGAVLTWRWLKIMVPFVNLYAALFLIGGAVYSALRYLRVKAPAALAQGNGLIAFGALLPGIGGSFARYGHVEILYVTELIGILFIYAGYRMCVKVSREQRVAARGDGEAQGPGAQAAP